MRTNASCRSPSAATIVRGFPVSPRLEQPKMFRPVTAGAGGLRAQGNTRASQYRTERPIRRRGGGIRISPGGCAVPHVGGFAESGVFDPHPRAPSRWGAETREPRSRSGRPSGRASAATRVLPGRVITFAAPETPAWAGRVTRIGVIGISHNTLALSRSSQSSSGPAGGAADGV